MEFRDLKIQYKKNEEDINQAIIKVLNTGKFIGGSFVTELEDTLAQYIGVKHCITCANGTDALQLALMNWGIASGDAVFVPDFTFFSSGEVVSLVGATPIFVDVRRDTFNISSLALEQMIKKVISEGKLIPKVIIVVDLFGQPAEFSAIRKIAHEYNLYVLEDGAQGFGGKIGQNKACSFGDISTTSFFPAKPLGCYGDGGAIFTDNDEWDELIRSYKVHGKGQNKYDNVRLGMNSRLDSLQAAILLEKYKLFVNHELNDVNMVADFYTEQLKSNVDCPVVLQDYYSSWAQYTITLPGKDIRDQVQKQLNEHYIPSMVYYAKPMHKQKAFKHLIPEDYLQDDLFDNTCRLCDSVLSLPMHPYIDKKEIAYISEMVKRIVSI